MSSFQSLPIYNVIISNIYSYPVNLSQDSQRFVTISLEIHLLISNFGVSHLRICTNFYVPFCISLIGQYSFNEKKIKFPRWLLSNSIMVPEHYIFVLLVVFFLIIFFCIFNCSSLNMSKSLQIIFVKTRLFLLFLVS